MKQSNELSLNKDYCVHGKKMFVYYKNYVNGRTGIVIKMYSWCPMLIQMIAARALSTGCTEKCTT